MISGGGRHSISSSVLRGEVRFRHYEFEVLETIWIIRGFIAFSMRHQMMVWRDDGGMVVWWFGGLICGGVSLQPPDLTRKQRSDRYPNTDCGRNSSGSQSKVDDSPIFLSM